MTMAFEFAFDVGNKVRIMDEGIDGTINALWVDRGGSARYEVEWLWSEGSKRKIHSKWCYACEIQEVPMPGANSRDEAAGG